jgi:hypothetical protein
MTAARHCGAGGIRGWGVGVRLELEWIDVTERVGDLEASGG